MEVVVLVGCFSHHKEREVSYYEAEKWAKSKNIKYIELSAKEN